MLVLTLASEYGNISIFLSQAHIQISVNLTSAIFIYMHVFQLPVLDAVVVGCGVEPNVVLPKVDLAASPPNGVGVLLLPV